MRCHESNFVLYTPERREKEQTPSLFFFIASIRLGLRTLTCGTSKGLRDHCVGGPLFGEKINDPKLSQDHQTEWGLRSHLRARKPYSCLLSAL